jgi:hypothetical protein
MVDWATMSETLSPPASAPAQEPKKHHYLPEFYLSAWCGADGKLERYVNRNGCIKTRRFTTGQVGYRTDLYRLLSANIPDRTTIERHHFEQLDNAPAPVIARLNRDRSPTLSEADKEAVARFMISLPARNPWGIAMGQQISRETYGLALGDETDARDLGLPENRTIWKQINEENPHFVADSTLMQMIEVSIDEEIFERFIRMRAWAVLDYESVSRNHYISIRLIRSPTMTVPKKPTRGRPRLYKYGTELYTIRIPKGLADQIEGAMAKIKTASGNRDATKAAILLDGLKRRLKSLENRDPTTRRTIEAIEQAEARILKKE